MVGHRCCPSECDPRAVQRSLYRHALNALELASRSGCASQDAREPFTRALSKWTGATSGIGPTVIPPVSEITIGVSRIHSAVAYVEAYGSVMLNARRVERSVIVIVQTSGTAPSAMFTRTRSPGLMRRSVRMLGAGIVSHQA